MKNLTALQNELKAPKSQFNGFGKYHYRNCEDILEAIKPLLEKHKLTLAITDELVMVGDRYYVKATAMLKSDTESLSVTAYAREEENKKGMDGSQVTGASSSYARKYALNGLFLIDDTKDADSQDNTAKVQSVKSTAKPQVINYVERNANGVHNCIQCSKEIKQHGQHTPASLVEKSIAKYGKVLCVDCANKLK